MSQNFKYSLKPLVSSREVIGKELYYFDELDSTNTWLLSQKDLLGQSGIVVLAKKQVSGRGRLGRVWDSGNYENLSCSILFHPEYELKYIPSTTLLVGIAIYRMLNELGVRELSIKWPNDILISGKKVSGILCDMTQTNQKNTAVIIGVGININGVSCQFSDEIQHKVTTLEQELGRGFDKFDLLNHLLNQLEIIFLDQKNKGWANLYKEWEKSSSSIGKKVTFEKGKNKIEGYIHGLSDDGSLIVQEASNNKLTPIYSGEVNFL